MHVMLVAFALIHYCEMFKNKKLSTRPFVVDDFWVKKKNSGKYGIKFLLGLVLLGLYFREGKNVAAEQRNLSNGVKSIYDIPDLDISGSR